MQRGLWSSVLPALLLQHATASPARAEASRTRRLSETTPCVAVTKALVDVIYRDFNQAHPDFWTDEWDWFATTGLVHSTLDSSTETATYPHARPTCKSPQGNATKLMLPNCDNFAQWYRDMPGVNSKYDSQLELDYDPATGISTFDSQAYFPMDGRGFNELTTVTSPVPGTYNFLFTSECT